MAIDEIGASDDSKAEPSTPTAAVSHPNGHTVESETAPAPVAL